MNIDELKPCPFCGNNKRLVEVVTRQGGHSICCDWCGGTTDSEDSTEEAKNAWNRRYERREQREGEWTWKRSGYMNFLCCSCCDKRAKRETAYCPNCGAKMKEGA